MAQSAGKVVTASVLLRTGKGKLKTASVGKVVAAGTLKLYNGTDSGGTLIHEVDGGTNVSHESIDIPFNTGLYAVVSGTAEYNVTWE